MGEVVRSYGYKYGLDKFITDMQLEYPLSLDNDFFRITFGITSDAEIPVRDARTLKERRAALTEAIEYEQMSAWDDAVVIPLADFRRQLPDTMLAILSRTDATAEIPNDHEKVEAAIKMAMRAVEQRDWLTVALALTCALLSEDEAAIPDGFYVGLSPGQSVRLW